MRTWEKGEMNTPVFNFSADICGVSIFDFFFDRFQINQSGGDDQQNSQHA